MLSILHFGKPVILICLAIVERYFQTGCTTVYLRLVELAKLDVIIAVGRIYQMPPRQLPTVARQGLKFLLKKLIEAPNLPASGLGFVWGPLCVFASFYLYRASLCF